MILGTDKANSAIAHTLPAAAARYVGPVFVFLHEFQPHTPHIAMQVLHSVGERLMQVAKQLGIGVRLRNTLAVQHIEVQSFLGTRDRGEVHAGEVLVQE